MKITFEITTTEKRSNWMFVAARKCIELEVDTRDCGAFIINGKKFQFFFNSNLELDGLIRLF